MKNHAALLLAGLALAVLVAIFLPSRTHQVPPPAPTASVAPSPQNAPAPQGAQSAQGAIAHPEIGFHSHERLVEHYRKHGRDFGDVDMATYLRLAQQLRDRPAGGDVVEAVRADDVITRFDRRGGAFLAFDRDLTIRTFFKPNDGDAYFRRQLGRRH